MVSNNSSSNETQSSGPKPVSDLPCKDPDWWFSAGVAATILFVIGLGWLAGFILSLDFPWADSSQAMQVFQPFLVALAGLVTLCTVVWRGLINEAQAKEQRRQNDAKDMADVGLLLEKATTFLSDESLMKRGVGLAMLDTVVTTPNSPYANFAVELVVDQLVPAMNKGSEGFEAAIQQIETTLKRAHNLGIHASRTRTYSFSNKSACMNCSFTLSPHLPKGTIEGAYIHIDGEFVRVQSLQGLGHPRWRFRRCEFRSNSSINSHVSPKVHVGSNFLECSFSWLQVRSLEAAASRALQERHLFKCCDFSNAYIHDVSDLDAVRLVDCVYREGFPPTIRGCSPEESVRLIEQTHGKLSVQTSEYVTEVMWGALD